MIIRVLAPIFALHISAGCFITTECFGAGVDVFDAFRAGGAEATTYKIVEPTIAVDAPHVGSTRMMDTSGPGITISPIAFDSNGVTNVRDFGARCDGTTDDAPAVQLAVDSGNTTYFPSAGCTSFYLVNATVTVPGHHAMIGPANGSSASVRIVTTAAVTTFVQAGDHCSYENLMLRHDGDAGYVIDLKDKSFCTIQNIAISADNAKNTDALIFFRGSMHAFDGMRLTNCRPHAFAMDNDGGKTSVLYGSSINNIISRSFILGSGSDCPASGMGIHIWSSDDMAHRPEGFVISDTVIATPNRISLQVEQVLNLNITDSTLDSGSGYTIYLKPKNTGIEGLSIKGGYISTGLDPQTGVCIYHDTSSGGRIGRTMLQGIQFSFCGLAIGFSTPASGLTIANNTFTQTNTVFDIRGTSMVNITGNIMASVKSFTLADGPSGGPFVIDQNQFPSGVTYTLIQTAPSKFLFGSLNTGLASTTGVR